MIIADIGSCWGYSVKNAIKCIKICKECGVDMVKFQLCGKTNGNIPINSEYLSTLVEYGNEIGVSISASIWNREGYNTVKESGATWIKFAHSASDLVYMIDSASKEFNNVIITLPLIINRYDYSNIKYLWTYEINGIPVYPVTCMIDHKKMYDRYDGFSCHCINPDELLIAANYGAKIIEFHANPLGVNDVPDSMFAYNTTEIEKICKGVKSLWS